MAIQFRRNTAAAAAASNPVLAAGEPGFETDTNTLKVGDGTTAWNDLDPINDGSSLKVLQVEIPFVDDVIIAGTALYSFRMPYAMTVSAVRISLGTAQTSGNIITVDINESGATILSTKLTVDNGQKTSTTATTPAVISDASLADDAEITFDVDQVGDGTGRRIIVTLIGS